ncbi:hypothetical protein M744_13415 [Synechococcus elongatus UTEX 2973]|nr:hypothetical protein M744_13415 [Synechococcus elongatus UTEX 2973]
MLRTLTREGTQELGWGAATPLDISPTHESVQRSPKLIPHTVDSSSACVVAASELVTDRDYLIESVFFILCGD